MTSNRKRMQLPCCCRLADNGQACTTYDECALNDDRLCLAELVACSRISCGRIRIESLQDTVCPGQATPIRGVGKVCSQIVWRSLLDSLVHFDEFVHCRKWQIWIRSEFCELKTKASADNHGLHHREDSPDPSKTFVYRLWLGRALRLPKQRRSSAGAITRFLEFYFAFTRSQNQLSHCTRKARSST
jgi:hypothetical protein